MPWYQWRADELILRLRVQPRSKRDAVDGLYGERLRVRVKAPPVDNRANEAVSVLLARAFKVPRSAIRLTQGASGQNKTFSIGRPLRLPDWFTSLGGATNLRDTDIA